MQAMLSPAWHVAAMGIEGLVVAFVFGSRAWFCD